MFGQKCSLCGGKLSRGICTECGLDNKKSRMYQVDDNTFDNKVEEIHETKGSISNEEFFNQIKEEQREMEVEDVFHRTLPKQSSNSSSMNMEDMAQKAAESSAKLLGQLQKEMGMKGNGRTKQTTSTSHTTYNTTYNTDAAGRKKTISKGSKLVRNIILFIVLIQLFGGIFFSVVGSLFETVFDVTESFVEDNADYETEEYINVIEYPDSSEYIVELGETGFSYNETLTAGMYTVGVHIPEGIYSIECVCNSSISIHDDEHGIYVNEYYWEENIGEIHEGIHLYSGATVEIEDEGIFVFNTDNANEEGTVGQENPNTETFSTNYAIAGKDIPAGMYDISVEEDTYGIVQMFLPDEEGNLPNIKDDDVYPDVSFFFANTTYDPEEVQPSSYKNFVIPEGALITIDEDTESLPSITLTPSPVIKDENYALYYIDYYY